MPITLTRACPGCAKRFGVRLKERTLLKSETESITTTASVAVQPASRSAAPRSVQVPETRTVTRQEFKEDYRCTRCGHEWSVVKTKARLNVPPIESVTIAVLSLVE